MNVTRPAGALGVSTMRTYASAVLLGSSLLLAAPITAAAQMTEVDVELVLAVDVSRSMDLEEQRVQRDGYISAFRHPEVIQAISSGELGKIAISYVEWAGSAYQNVVVPWTIIANEKDSLAFADKLEESEPANMRGTSISNGLAFAAQLFETSGVSGLRQTIDVSGDGANNMGPPVVPMRDRVVAQGITVNGLPIMLRPALSPTIEPFGIADLDVYYEDCVIGGPGAFMITVKDVSQFQAAIRRKLVLEIAGLEPQPKLIRVAEMTKQPRVDCLIGEKERGRWFVPENR
jgi:hypothetical protein